MPRAPTKTMAVLFANLSVSVALYAVLTLGRPGWAEELKTFLLCTAAGTLSAVSLNQILKEGEDVFGRKQKEDGVNWEEKIKSGNTVEEKAEEKVEIAEQTSKAVLPGKVASEAVKALAGIKALIESLQVTDEATWAEVEEKGRKALGLLVKMESALETALEASREARAVLEELITVAGEHH